MGDIVFNIVKGREITYFANAAGDVAAAQIVCLLLTAAEATDGAQADFDTVAALLAGASTEATFTNYARKDIEDSDITITVDDTDDEATADIVDQTFVAAGNGSNEALTDVVFAYDPTGSSADSALIPISQHDLSITTDGSDLAILIDATGLVGAT